MVNKFLLTAAESTYSCCLCRPNNIENSAQIGALAARKRGGNADRIFLRGSLLGRGQLRDRQQRVGADADTR